MAAVTRLVTFVDLGTDDPGPDARRMSVTARHEAVLVDGRRVLLADRGWSGTQAVARGGTPSDEERDRPGIWATETVEEITREARVVVGPDEPFEGHSQADMEGAHWDAIVRLLRGHGVEVSAVELKELPHDVELSDRVLARAVGRQGARKE